MPIWIKNLFSGWLSICLRTNDVFQGVNKDMSKKLTKVEFQEILRHQII